MVTMAQQTAAVERAAMDPDERRDAHLRAFRTRAAMLQAAYAESRDRRAAVTLAADAALQAKALRRTSPPAPSGPPDYPVQLMGDA